MIPTVKGNRVIATNSHPMKGRSGFVRSGLNYQCFGDKEGMTLVMGQIWAIWEKEESGQII